MSQDNVIIKMQKALREALPCVEVATLNGELPEKIRELLELSVNSSVSDEKTILISVNSLFEIQESVEAILDNMEHYLENKCCPSPDEVRQVRLLLQDIKTLSNQG